MTRYEFQDTLHRTSSEMHQHIAEAYLTAGGHNDADDIHAFFAEQTDAELADDAIAGWGLNATADFERDELIKALGRLRHDYH